MSALFFEKVDYNDYMERALHGKAPLGKPRTTREAGGSFYGASWSEAVRLAENGWAEGRELVGSILSDVELGQHSLLKPQPVWDVSGDFVDVGAYVTGEPECMVSSPLQETDKRFARILVNLSASGGVERSVLRWRGAAALALIDRLEDSGVRCEVDIGFCNRASDGVWTITANVKRAEDPLYIDRLAFHLAHPASLRRIMWSFAEAGPASQAQRHSFYYSGHCGIPVTEIEKHLPKEEKYDLIVPGLQLQGVKEAIETIEALFHTVCPTKEQQLFDELQDSV